MVMRKNEKASCFQCTIHIWQHTNNYTNILQLSCCQPFKIIWKIRYICSLKRQTFIIRPTWLSQRTTTTKSEIFLGMISSLTEKRRFHVNLYTLVSINNLTITFWWRNRVNVKQSITSHLMWIAVNPFIWLKFQSCPLQTEPAQFNWGSFWFTKKNKLTSCYVCAHNWVKFILYWSFKESNDWQIVDSAEVQAELYTCQYGFCVRRGFSVFGA